MFLCDTDAREAHLLPGEDVVRLSGCLDCLCVEFESHETDGQLGVVVDVRVADARCLVERLVEQQVTHVLHLCDVAGGEEVLEVGQAVAARVGVQQLVVDAHVFHLDARHLEEEDEVVERLRVLARADHVGEVRGIVGLEERGDRLGDQLAVELRLSEQRPDVRLVPVGGELDGALHVLQVLEKNLDGLGS